MALDSTENTTNRRTFIKYTSAGTVGAVLAGCMGSNDQETTDTESGNGDSDESGGDTSTDDDSSGNGDLEIPRFGWLLTGNLRTLDPGRATDRPITISSINFYDNLVTVNSDAEVVENVATDWEIQEGGERVVFSLRDDITFHSGNQLTAEDVAYSMERIVNEEMGLFHLWEGIIEPGGTEVVDDTTVAFNLEQPYEPFIPTLVQLHIIDSKTVQENEQDGDYGREFLNRNVAGSGPYQLPEPLEGGDPSRIQMEAFEDYWQGWEDNQFDRAQMRKVEEESTIINLIRTGEAHMTDPVLSLSTYDEINSFDNGTVMEAEQFAVFHIGLHTQKPPTDDPKVREAFAYAYDYESAINNVFQGGVNPPGVVPVSMPGHNDDLEPIEQDLDRAQQALEESSYSVEEINEIGVEHVHVAEIERQRNVGLLFKNSLSELGIEVEVNPLTWAQMTERVAQMDTSPTAINILYASNYPSPDSFLYGPYHPSNSGSWQSVSWLDDDDLVETLENARTATDRDQATELYKDAQQMIYDAYPGIFIVNQPLRVGFNANVEGYAHKGVSGFYGRIHDMSWSQ